MIESLDEKNRPGGLPERLSGKTLADVKADVVDYIMKSGPDSVVRFAWAIEGSRAARAARSVERAGRVLSFPEVHERPQRGESARVQLVDDPAKAGENG